MASTLSFGPRGPGFNSNKRQMFFSLGNRNVLEMKVYFDVSILVDSTLRGNKSDTLGK